MTFSEEDILWALVETQYEAGVSITRISEQTGLPRTSIYDYLLRKGLRKKAPKAGPQEREECQRGHAQAEWARPLDRGGTFCLKCRRLRDARRARRKYWERKEAEREQERGGREGRTP